MKVHCNGCYTSCEDYELVKSKLYDESGKDKACWRCGSTDLCDYDPKLHNWWNNGAGHRGSNGEFIIAAIAMIITMGIPLGLLAFLIWLAYQF